MKNQSFSNRLRFALSGIRHAVVHEASLRTQLILGLLAALLLALEIFNTALELLADRLHPERHESIQLAKDCAAGAVLIASLAALVIGAMTLAVGLGWVPVA